MKSSQHTTTMVTINTDWELFKRLLTQPRFEFVLRGRRTGNAYTYRVRHAFDMVHIYKLSGYTKTLVCTFNVRLDGSWGELRVQHSVRDYIWSMALMWVLRMLRDGKDIGEQVSWQHTGNCARCGKPLTDPESVSLGMGPTCRQR